MLLFPDQKTVTLQAHPRYFTTEGHLLGSPLFWANDRIIQSVFIAAFALGSLRSEESVSLPPIKSRSNCQYLFLRFWCSLCILFLHSKRYNLKTVWYNKQNYKYCERCLKKRSEIYVRFPGLRHFPRPALSLISNVHPQIPLPLFLRYWLYTVIYPTNSVQVLLPMPNPSQSPHRVHREIHSSRAEHYV
jgi:hypothetical protein